MPAARLTHFLCLPLVTQSSRPQLQQSLRNFAAAVTSTYDVQPKAIRPIGTLHLTLGVMHLAAEEQVEAASKFLRSLDVTEMLKRAVPQAVQAEAPTPLKDSSVNSTIPESIKSEASAEPVTSIQAPEAGLSPPPLMVSISGLKSMHTPSKTSVLYTTPEDPTSRLLVFATALREAFASANLLVSETRPLLLHATIVNTLYAKTKRAAKGTGHRKDKRDVAKLDATALLEEFQDFEWAKDVRIEKISICQMGAKKEIVDGVVVNEEYVETASVPLP